MELGQYFTTNESLQLCVANFIKNNPAVILEPSIGKGHLLTFINPNIEIHAYEIDTSLISVPNVIYKDFLKADINTTYDTIIGNPPYIKTSKGNLYIDFIEKCVSLLNPNGELIFIIPSDFFKLTSAINLITYMLAVGSFTDIYHPNDDRLFNDATIDVLVFRYQLGYFSNTINYNEEMRYVKNTNGTITFELNNNPTTTIGEYFDIYVGLVSGAEKIYKTENGNVDILTDFDTTERYIMLDTFPAKCDIINQHLLKHKDELLSRKIRKFNNKNWYKWGAPRNIKKMISHMGAPCIYIRNLTRQEQVAQVSHTALFGAKLLMLIPKSNMTAEDLQHFANHMNSQEFKKKYTYSGRFKIGQKNMVNAIIPVF